MPSTRSERLGCRIFLLGTTILMSAACSTAPAEPSARVAEIEGLPGLQERLPSVSDTVLSPEVMMTDADSELAPGTSLTMCFSGGVSDDWSEASVAPARVGIAAAPGWGPF